MLPSLFALGRRLHQPTGLAVVITPLALLVCCVLMDQALPGDQQVEVQMRAISKNTDGRISDSSFGRLQSTSVTSMAAVQATPCHPKAAWFLGKSQLTRRIAERWAPGLLVSFGAFSFSPSFAFGPTPPKVLDASSPEYLILRRLRL